MLAYLLTLFLLSPRHGVVGIYALRNISELKIP